ncbi:AAA family ATPase [Paracoccus litorisediminis]|uniref:AAA family ATPase n=1 Tax=Paracoccus litorisediminis TaxID=2006130 RepID=A0A844HU60_9RHOB|nr:SMC family ATPase [Paracoccus litorisediminis]MTH61111.1 AAA family ATPase [Paracoccus litorisediminis]
MKLHKIHIENFLVLTEASVGLADRGLVLIQGMNHQDSSANSNGAGKSSIADALCWAIYGTTARGESGDQVVNDKAGKNTRVEVTIEDQNVIYTIARHRKHKTGKNSLTVTMDAGSGLQDLTGGTDKLTQDVVNKIMGCSLEVFTGSIYAGQEKMPDLPAMTDKMLKILIEEAAGVDALEEAYVLARSKAASAKQSYEMTRGLVQQAEAAAAMLSSQKQMAEQDELLWEQNRQAREEAIKEEIANVLNPEHDRLHKAVIDADIPGIEAGIDATDAAIQQTTQEQAALAVLTQAKARADAAVTLAQTQARQAIADHARTEKAVQEVQHKIGCPCDSCGRPLTPAEMAVAEQAAINAHDQSRAQVVAVTTSIKDAQSAAQKAAQEVLDFQTGMTDVSAEMARRATLQGALTEAQKLVAQNQAVQVQINAKAAEIAQLRGQVSPFTARIADLDQKIITANQSSQTLTQELIVKASVLALETEVVRVFSPAGVRSRILDEVTPYLNAQTSKYLAILSDGNITAEWSTLTVNKAGDVKEKFAIDVTSGISAKTFKGLSGGEKRKVRVATALALQDLVATRATKPIELFIGDEIDDALDASGIERLMAILDEKAKERGTVMVISHNELRDFIPQVLLVERSAAGETHITENAA